MEYRILGRTGAQVSAISLGTEYLIDRPRDQMIGVIHAAIDAGVNYFDLFFAQPDFRDVMGAAFCGHRQKVMLAAHLGAAHRDGQYERTRDPERAAPLIEDFLRRYRTDYVDVLMLHNYDEQAEYDALMAPGGLLEVAQRLQEAGKARWIGFSGHTVETARQAVESGVVDVLMFPVNLAGHAIPGKKALFETCAQEDVGLVAMKPYAGGRLLRDEGPSSLERWQLGGEEREVRWRSALTPVQCLAYVLAQTGVSTIVPGCETVEHVRQAQSYWEAPAEARDFAEAMRAFETYVAGECVYCNHCLPCPSQIDIGQTLRLLDQSVLGGVTPALREAYETMEADAEDCIQCGVCEERCPFGVAVVGRMEEAARVYG